MITSNIKQKITQYLFSEKENNQHQSVESCYPKIFRHMVKFMLHFLDAEIQTTYMYGRNNHNLKHIICPNKKTYVKNVVYNEVIKDITSE